MTLIEQLRQGIVTDSAEKTRAIAKALASALPPVVTLALHGDLGVGKTTFVQGLAEGFGVSERVTSPTFSIFSIHQGGRRSLVHLDAYRLENERQMEALLLEDFLVNSYCLAVEWPEKITAWLPSDTWHLTLSIVDGSRHRIALK